jgi:hypothetical protein
VGVLFSFLLLSLSLSLVACTAQHHELTYVDIIYITHVLLSCVLQLPHHLLYSGADRFRSFFIWSLPFINESEWVREREAKENNTVYYLLFVEHERVGRYKQISVANFSRIDNLMPPRYQIIVLTSPFGDTFEAVSLTYLLIRGSV